jgi:hypothetical protein
MISISTRVHFFIGFANLPVPVRDVWDMLRVFLNEHDALPKNVELSQMAGHSEEQQSEQILKLPIAKIGEIITSRNLAGFKIYAGKSAKTTDYYLLDYRSTRKDFKLGCLIENEAKAPSDWAPLIEKVLSRHECVGAWQYIKSYQFWQGDITGDRFYEMRWGKLPPGYRTRTEPFTGPGLQPDRVFIDISLNPGRFKQLSPMVSFLPTAEMWLGPHFWQYAKCTKEEALAADFFIEKLDTPHYLYLKCWPEAFTRPDGEQGRMQQRLWKLFFHEDCEWPPGSGTICDEPMYGPPELMPGYVPPAP